MDFAQGEMLPEQFAVRFKYEEQAKLFQTKFVECQSALDKNGIVEKSPSQQQQQSEEPAVIEKIAESAEDKEEIAGEYENGDEGEDDDDGAEEGEYDDEEEEYEDVEESVMFEKRCTLSSLEKASLWTFQATGNLKIVYDDEMLCARIVFEADGHPNRRICDNVIAIETKLKVMFFCLVCLSLLFGRCRFNLSMQLVFVDGRTRVCVVGHRLLAGHARPAHLPRSVQFRRCSTGISVHFR